MRWSGIIIMVGMIIFTCVRGLSADCPQFFDGVQRGTVESGMLGEISGIAASRKNSDVLWVHNDSGDSARVYAMDGEGKHLGVYQLSGVSARDWEDMSIGAGPAKDKEYLYLGDIGDNSAVRGSIVVYRVEEPMVDWGQAAVSETLGGVESLRLQYPDGARDAEVLIVDPATRDLYIVSKRETYSRIYVARYPQSTDSITVMEYKGQLPWGWTTGGDASVDGSLVVVRRYTTASVWRRTAEMELWEAFGGQECVVPIVSEPQGEAICFDAEGCGYYTVSEGSYQPIYYFGRDGECPLEGDIDGDGDVDAGDIEIFAGRWLDLSCSSVNLWCANCDVDKSSGVDFADFAYAGADWGK